MVRMVFIVAGVLLLALAAALAGGARMLVTFPLTPQQVSRLLNWALGLGIIGFMLVALALINWAAYHPSNIQLPFVNER